MKRKILSGSIGFLFSMLFLSLDLPKHWYPAGDKPEYYEMGIEKAGGKDGEAVATVKSIGALGKGFGTLMQQCSPREFAGKRIRLFVWMKTRKVTGWAGMWLRVDQANSRQPLSFDNMQDRALKGNTDWRKYEIVLDVPPIASNIAYGGLLSGEGQLWFGPVTFEVVDTATPITGGNRYDAQQLDAPANLDFRE